MIAERPRIRFFVDECVPDSVGRVLEDAGHEVIWHRKALVPGSPDQIVASVSEIFGAVLVSLDADFDKLAPRIGVSRRRFRKLSRIAIKCAEPLAARRIEGALSLIEHEWTLAQGASDPRMIIEISHTAIRTIR